MVCDQCTIAITVVLIQCSREWQVLQSIDVFHLIIYVLAALISPTGIVLALYAGYRLRVLT